jgi:hypothetical protein
MKVLEILYHGGWWELVKRGELVCAYRGILTTYKEYARTTDSILHHQGTVTKRKHGFSI